MTYLAEGVQILVAPLDSSLEGKLKIELEQSGYRPTSASVDDSMDLIQVLEQLTIALGSRLNVLPSSDKPTGIEIDFKLSYSGTRRRWIVNAGGEHQIGVKLKWSENG